MTALKTLRKQHGYTQATLAEHLHLSTNGYAKIERGETRLTLDKINALSVIFNINQNELLKILQSPLPSDFKTMANPLLLNKTIGELTTIIATQAQEIAELKLQLAEQQEK